MPPQRPRFPNYHPLRRIALSAPTYPPSGNQDKTFQVLKEKALEYSLKIYAAPMSKETTLWSYLLYLLPKLTFSLMATMLTEDQCNKIQSPTLMAALPKLHFNRHTERSIIHGPLLHGGLNLPHLYTIQGISQLKFLIGHLRAQDKTFKLIIISHGYLQLLVRTQSKFLNSPYQIYSWWACHSWFVSLWQLMDKAQVKTHTADAWLPPHLAVMT
jgi:hypothetical protein